MSRYEITEVKDSVAETYPWVVWDHELQVYVAGFPTKGAARATYPDADTEGSALVAAADEHDQFHSQMVNLRAAFNGVSVAQLVAVNIRASLAAPGVAEQTYMPEVY